MGKSTPKAPDYTAAAEATAESNQQALDRQTWANRVNQFNPWGSITYAAEEGVDPSTGEPITIWTQNQELTPLAQEALDRQMAIDANKSDFANALMQRAGESLLQDTDWSKFQGYSAAPQAWGTAEGTPQTPVYSYAQTPQFSPDDYDLAMFQPSGGETPVTDTPLPPVNVPNVPPTTSPPISINDLGGNARGEFGDVTGGDFMVAGADGGGFSGYSPVKNLDDLLRSLRMQ